MGESPEAAAPLRVETTGARDDVRCAFVRQQLRAYNQAQSAHMRPENKRLETLDVFLLDAAGAVRGGLVATTRWGVWLDVDLLWVDESLRGRGHGAALMAAAEDAARRRGCAHARVGTHGFQAKGFYERIGYRVVGKLDDWPPGHTAYMLRKDL